jgi:hypothetical protein
MIFRPVTIMAVCLLHRYLSNAPLIPVIILMRYDFGLTAEYRPAGTIPGPHHDLNGLGFFRLWLCASSPIAAAT